MTFEELRKQFEKNFRTLLFSLKRNKTGEYISMATFQAWGGYKICAKINGILNNDVDVFKDENYSDIKCDEKPLYSNGVKCIKCGRDVQLSSRQLRPICPYCDFIISKKV